MAADQISASRVRRKKFEMVRRGFDPQEVGAFLEQVATRLAEAERGVEEATEKLTSQAGELQDARAAEEALQMTMVAATQAKDEMLARANTQADETRTEARREAESVISQARRQALELIEESRREANEVVTAARDENRELLQEVEGLKSTVTQIRELLENVALDALPGLEKAIDMLDDPASVEPKPSVQFEPIGDKPLTAVVAAEIDGAGDSTVDVEAAEVERLLKQLRGA